MNPLKFFLDDPVYPGLAKTAPVPDQSPLLPFDVNGFTPGEYDLTTVQGRAANCYAALAVGIDQFLKIRPGEIHWARTQRLLARPAAGKNWNAFYDRRNLQFFFNWDTVRQRMVYAASSPRIVIHELGHGLLDAIRPDFWNLSTMFEVWALHEAFGDIFSFAYAVSNDEVLQQALTDTGNDLSKSNLISGLAQEFYMGLTSLPSDQIQPLRDATTLFIYTDPNSLPKTGSREQLIREAHSFSRIFSGMVYDFFVRVHQTKTSDGMAPFQAAKEAMAVAVHYVVATAAYVAVRADFFDSYARCMLFVDFQAGQPFSQQLYAAFSDRNILHDVKVQEMQPEPEHPPTLQVTNSGHSLCVFRQSKTIVVSREPGIRALDFNPLYDLEIEVAMDRHREYDRFQHLAVDDYTSHQATVDAVAVTLDILYEKNLVGDDVHQPFQVDGKKLTRKHFAC